MSSLSLILAQVNLRAMRFRDEQPKDDPLKDLGEFYLSTAKEAADVALNLETKNLKEAWMAMAEYEEWRGKLAESLGKVRIYLMIEVLSKAEEPEREARAKAAYLTACLYIAT